LAMERMLGVLVMLGIMGDRVRAEDVMQSMEKKASKFAALLRSTPGLHTAYLDSFVTVFAPHDTAFDQFEGEWDENTILNHMVGSAVSREDMRKEERLTSLMMGHPPIWVRLVRNVLYVNHAQVKFIGRHHSSEGNKKQFLYLIDSVLEPLLPLASESRDLFVDIKAGDLLSSPEQRYGLGEYSVNIYSQRLQLLGLEQFQELNKYGKSTFFIPVDQAFDDMRVGLVDREVVRAHIVPGHLLFTRPHRRRAEAKPTAQYNTSRLSLDLKVMAKVYHEEQGDIAESQTLVGTKQHGRGKVKATILKGNIPVQNGLVHLISSPLVVVAMSLWELIDPAKPHNQRFKGLASLVVERADMVARLTNLVKGTLLVPTNEAFKLVNMDREERDWVLGWHLLNTTIQTDDVRITMSSTTDPDTGMFGVETASGKLWMWTEGGTTFVEGGGVRAQVVEENVGASNGVIHGIDRVLGVPTETVLDLLSTDPMTRKTYELGNQEHFNSLLSSKEANFTYFVPTDRAWHLIKRDFATAYKILFLGEFFYQAHHVLDRHLKVGAKLSLSDLVSLGTVGMKRGSPLTVEKSEKGVMVIYDDIQARVVRGDLECTNGYVHLIDKVIMKRRDITLGEGSSLLPSLLSVLLTILLSFLLH